jgi:hypothetical protein
MSIFDRETARVPGLTYAPKDQSEQVSGGCFCGSVRFEARAYIRDAYYCHCRTCQKISGAPAGIGVFVEPGSLRFTKGEPQFFQTSHFAERGFCRDCGSRLIWKHIGTQHPELTNLDVGCLDHPEHVVPTSHQCVESQLPWYQFDDGLPRLRSEENPELVALWESASKIK